MKSDIKTIVSVIKEIVKGYYVIIKRETDSYNMHKFNKEDFISLFSNGDGQWHIESDGDLTRFLLTSATDTNSTDSNILKTFNAYEVEGTVKIASVAVVCDWSIFELAFNGKEPKEVVEMARSENK